LLFSSLFAAVINDDDLEVPYASSRVGFFQKKKLIISEVDDALFFFDSRANKVDQMRFCGYPDKQSVIA
jgi:hypothetical protein